jgi:hypothetical protein
MRLLEATKEQCADYDKKARHPLNRACSYPSPSTGANYNLIDKVECNLGNRISACKRLNLPAFSHRSFRRMFIVRAIEKGVPVHVIAQWQGHSGRSELILDTYSYCKA